MDRIGSLSSGHDSRLSDNDKRDNTASSSSDASVFGRTLESRAVEIPNSSQLPPDTESASTSSSERKTGVKIKLKSKNFASLSKQRRKINDRERARTRLEKAALITLKEKLGENYLPSDQNPMKLSKVKTLFGAIDYINNLTELLAQDSPEHSDTLHEAGNNNNDIFFMGHGISSQFIDLSHLRGCERKKILDIGSGSGIIAKRIRDELGCDVFAIEPSLEESNGVERDPFISSCNELGQNKVEKCTLQEAIKNTKYQQAFEVVTVHNYNVNLAEKQDFLAALSKVIKPDGCVLIHTVEHERIIKTHNYEILYLLDDLKLYFAEVSFERRSYQNGSDAIIRCTGPRNC